MKRGIDILGVILFVTAPLPAQQVMPLLGASGGALPSSNIALVQAKGPLAPNSGNDCYQNSGTAYNCAISSTGAGELLLIVEEDADNPAQPSVPTASGMTCTLDKSLAQTSNDGRQTIFSCPNVSAGIVSVTLHPVSGHSSATVRRYTGTALTAPLDAVVTAKVSYTAATALASATLAASQYDLALAFACTGGSATAGMSPGAGFANGQDFTNTADATDCYAVDLLNASPTQITGLLSGNSLTYTVWLTLYKSAVAGSAPSGNIDSFYTDFEAGANGGTLSNANLAAATHGGSCSWAISGAALTIATLGQKPTVLNQSAQGATLAAPDAGTRGFSYDPGNGGAEATCTLNAGHANLDAGIWWKSPAIVPDITTHSVLTVGLGGSDFATPALPAGSAGMVCETQGGDSAAFLTVVASTWYRITVQYHAGGSHTCRAYDISGTQLGTASHLATGSFNATQVIVGNSHAGIGTPTNLAYEDNLVVDYLNDTFPLLP